MGLEDVTSVLREKRVMGLYNVPYTQVCMTQTIQIHSRYLYVGISVFRYICMYVVIYRPTTSLPISDICLCLTTDPFPFSFSFGGHQSVRDLYGYSEAAKEEPFEFDYWQVRGHSP